MSEPLKVVYVLLHFPRLTETFIADEIWALAAHDVDVRIVALLVPAAGPVQPRSRELLRQVSYASGVFTWATWRAQCYFLVRSFRLYLSLLITLLRQPYGTQSVRKVVKRLIVFVKAVSVAHMLRDADIDLFHSHFAWLPGAAAWICARLLGKPFTVTVHAYDIYSHKNDLLPLVTGAAAQVIAVSEANRSHVYTLGNCSSERVSVIHCGIDLSDSVRDASAQHTARVRREADAPIRLLSVGSLETRKGHHDLVTACHLLSERGVVFTCTIIGGGPDERALRAQIRALGLEDRVDLQGARSHPDILAAHGATDVFVLACVVAPDGDRDGIPVVLMEAGNAGLAMVSTTVSGIPELVRHGETGWLVPPNDAGMLAAAIAALAGDAHLRRRLGANARALVQAQFNIVESSRQLAAVFRDVTGRIGGDVRTLRANASFVLG